MNFPYRYVARIIVEAETPLAIGSDSKEFDQDAPVTKDCNDMPIIPGTAITGFLRAKLGKTEIFGDEATDNESQTKGSNFICSDAYLLDANYQAHQQPTNLLENEHMQFFENLPRRQHVKINHFGAAEKEGLFDREIVYKGSRFKFEIALELENEDTDNNFDKILNRLCANDFYIGGGQFNNFGELKVLNIEKRCFEKNTTDYLEICADLNKPLNGKNHSFEIRTELYEEKIPLSGKNSFFHFGAGYGDDEVDNVNYKEPILIWTKNNKNGKFKTELIRKFVIPGTSIKGALSHRVAFYYNKENGIFVDNLITDIESTAQQLEDKYDIETYQLADNLDDLEKQKIELQNQLKALDKEKPNTTIDFSKYVGTNNQGVRDLFGCEKNDQLKDENNGSLGNVIFKDIYLDKNTKQTIFYHNKIDRYTGGTIEGALFSEKVLIIDTETLYYKTTKKLNKTYLDMALDDFKNGMLPIGGLVNKGHGIFVEIKDKENGK